MGLQEYARARAGNAGMTEIGVVTLWERPTRVIVTALFLLGAGIYLDAAAGWATAGAAAWATLGAVGLSQLLVVVRRRLTGTTTDETRSGVADQVGDDLG
jgi:CDP-diacylglycerol--glycerol-3-phosphate 3-phosphatidyltransferase